MNVFALTTRATLALAIVACSSLAQAEIAVPVMPEAKQNKTIMGWAEKIRVFPGNVLIHAKISPDEDSTSIHATKIKEFKKGRKEWVKFALTDRSGEEVIVEREILRIVSIRSKKGTRAKRYLVQLGICIGSDYEEAEVRLVNRGSKPHRAKIGRNVLAGNAYIDPSKSFQLNPNCTVPTGEEHETEAPE